MRILSPGITQVWPDYSVSCLFKCAGVDYVEVDLHVPMSLPCIQKCVPWNLTSRVTVTGLSKVGVMCSCFVSESCNVIVLIKPRTPAVDCQCTLCAGNMHSTRVGEVAARARLLFLWCSIPLFSVF